VARFDATEFFSRALNVRIEGRLPRGTVAVPDLLDALRPHFNEPTTLPLAMTAFQDIARDSSLGERESLRKFLEARLSEVRLIPSVDAVQVHRLEDWLKGN
jgi:hypothetical protein